ncbi:MAG: AIR carboxylase family protein [Fidelibacterota bacterium]
MSKRSSGKAVLILGSPSDQKHANQIASKLETYDINHDQHVASAHKTPEKVLKILDSYKDENAVVYVTIAGRSNALSGFVAANSTFPTLACPPFKDRIDMVVNIHSTLQMPSDTPVLTILNPANCALAVKRILDLATGEAEN